MAAGSLLHHTGVMTRGDGGGGAQRRLAGLSGSWPHEGWDVDQAVCASNIAALAAI
jgi:hypothetical protein